MHRFSFTLRQNLYKAIFGFALLLALIAGAACADTPASPTRTPSPSPSPSPTPTPPVRFFTFGDWGTGDSTQQGVATALESHCAAQGCDFGLLLGDNFYEVGVASVIDSQWVDKFENVYALDLPFYALLGNHDYDGNETAEIDYSELQDRWKMPAPNYQIRFPAGSNPPWLEIFVIDSNKADSNTAAALEEALAASTAKWKIAAMHHPLYSNGPHPDNELGQNTLLLPLLCPAVDLVLSGHNHFFAQLDDPNDGCRLQQFIVGTGGKSLHSINPDPRAIYSEASHGFGWAEVKSDSLILEFRRSDGSLGYRYEAPLAP
jgi:tartrate-resistant acid phosphatase type 5